MKSQGFTLVETLVAITILLIGVIGPLNLAVRGITDGLYVQNELAASYLAQEAIETAVSIRQLNVANSAGPQPWDQGFPTSCALPANPSAACGVDPSQPAITPNCTTSGAPCALAYDRSQGIYDDASLVADTDRLGPVFTRRVYLVPDNFVGTSKLDIVVIVTWQNKTAPRTLMLTNHFYPRAL